ncbi:MAG: glycosyltransferase family 4 protein [Gallionella sp.]|nr:glycosyltransferase family 4 protein [Gallionella sp.]
MKLMFAIKRLENSAGGSERVLARICSELAHRGHEVSVLTWDAPGSQPYYPFNPAVRVINRGLGDSSQPTRPREFLTRLFDLRRAVSEAAPDVVIGFGHSMFVPLAFATLGMTTPVVGSEHAVMAHYETRPLQYFLLRASARLLRKITVISDAGRLGYTADVRPKLFVMPNPILAEVLPSRGRTRDNPGIILNVGRLDPQKNQDALIRAFARVADQFPTWRLRIMGEGPLRPRLEALIVELGLSTRVAMPGLTQSIDAEYASADLFALSSAYESFGLVSIEAMSHGLAVLGFKDCPGTNEVVLDGVTGLLVGNDPDRVSSFAEGLRQLMADADLRARLGEAARQRIATLAERCDVVDRWEAFLTSIRVEE